MGHLARLNPGRRRHGARVRAAMKGRAPLPVRCRPCVLQDAGEEAVYTAPRDKVFDRYTAFEPDVMFIRTERLEIVTERNVSRAPGLVAEVLSESTPDGGTSDRGCAPLAGKELT